MPFPRLALCNIFTNLSNDTISQNPINDAKSSFFENIQENLEYGFTTYSDFIFGLIMGLALGWIYHRILGGRSLRISYELLLKGKDETINAYRALVSEKLDKMDTPEYDKAWFKRLKKFFRQTNR